jgi:hypothetical protein
MEISSGKRRSIGTGPSNFSLVNYLGGMAMLAVLAQLTLLKTKK